jgi:hypothetical protein
MLRRALLALQRAVSSLSVQCKGVTKTGKQCKNKTKNTNGYCYLHENQAKNDKIFVSRMIKVGRYSAATCNFQWQPESVEFQLDI